jgi:hypothetical protein
MGFRPNNRNICLLNIPTKIVTIPKNNQKGNIVFSPFALVRAAARFRQRTVCLDKPDNQLWAGAVSAWEQASFEM